MLSTSMSFAIHVKPGQIARYRIVILKIVHFITSKLVPSAQFIYIYS